MSDSKGTKIELKIRDYECRVDVKGSCSKEKLLVALLALSNTFIKGASEKEANMLKDLFNKNIEFSLENSIHKTNSLAVIE